MIAIGPYCCSLGSTRRLCQGRRSLLFVRDFLYNGIVILRFRVWMWPQAGNCAWKRKTRATHAFFLSFAMRLGNATIIMTPHVHLHHSGFLTWEILNSLFLLQVFQPVLTQTNTIHFAHRTYLCNGYYVMKCDTRGQLTFLRIMQK